MFKYREDINNKMEVEIITRMWKAGKGTLVFSIGKNNKEFYNLEENDWIKIRILEVIKADKLERNENVEVIDEVEDEEVKEKEIPEIKPKNNNIQNKPTTKEVEKKHFGFK